MILTCPACTMRYLVSDGAVGTEGRRVRCAHCGHQWFEAAEAGLDEELFAKDAVFVSAPAEERFEESNFDAGLEDDSFGSMLRKEMSQDIPEGVRPRADDSGPAPVIPAKAGQLRGAIAGLAAAVMFYAVVVAGFFALHAPIGRMWPASNLIYGLAGIAPLPPGEGLSLDKLAATIEADRIVLRGDILNLRGKTISVPPVMATIVDTGGKSVGRLLIPPPMKDLKAEGQAGFTAEFPGVPRGAKNATFAFSYLKPAPDEAPPPPAGLEQSDLAEPPPSRH